MSEDDRILTYVDRLGVPLALLVVTLFTGWKILRWLAPRAEKWTERWVKSQELNAKSLADLADKSIEMHETSIQLQRESMSLQRDNSATQATTANILAEVVRSLNGSKSHRPPAKKNPNPPA